MTQKRLNHVILHTHKEQTDEIDLTDIAKKFVNCNDRRLSFFGFLKHLLFFVHNVSPMYCIAAYVIGTRHARAY